jgi:hypothetical protein
MISPGSLVFKVALQNISDYWTHVQTLIFIAFALGGSPRVSFVLPSRLRP